MLENKKNKKNTYTPVAHNSHDNMVQRIDEQKNLEMNLNTHKTANMYISVNKCFANVCNALNKIEQKTFLNPSVVMTN